MPTGSLGLRFFCAAALVAGATTGAAAQFPDLRQLFAPAPSTGSVPAPASPLTPPAPAPTSAPGEWSGEDGASGHPLMTRQAILTAAANFPHCLEAQWPDAARRGIS